MTGLRPGPRLGHAYLVHGDPDQQLDGLRLLADAVRNHSGLTPAERCEMARVWGCAARDRDDWPAAAEAYKVAIDTLPSIVSRRLDRIGEHRELAALHLLPAEAAEACANAGDVEGAVAALEQGRGLLLTRALDQRTDLDDLARAHPDLARRFSALVEAFDSLSDPNHWLPSSASDRRHELAALWDALIAEIRREPPFTRFLMAPEPSDLLPIATADAVVYLNAGWKSAHALLLTTAGIRCIPLADLSLSLATDLVNVCLHSQRVLQSPIATPTEIYRAELTLSDLLATLWDRLVTPILTALGYTTTPTDTWPHIRWIATGPFAFLPIHAAATPDQALLDCAISSYTPTARLARRPADTTGSVLAVAVPGDPPLEAVHEEAQLVIDTMGGTLIPAAQATRSEILSLLGTHPRVHFACHALSDLTGLAGAHLLLSDAPLTVTDIARLNVPEGSLAFLSACGTAQGSIAILDQAIHICTAFQVAGYSHVIGTLWPVADAIAYAVTKDVYVRLSTGTPPAQALHHAIRVARSQYPHSPWFWAAYAHFGH